MKIEKQEIINNDRCPLCHQKHSTSSKDIALKNLESFNNETKEAQRVAMREELIKEIK